MYPYGIIGNSALTALIDTHARVDWLCIPAIDSPPFFGRLLDPEGGHLAITMPGRSSARQRYIEGTPILVTELTGEDGTVRITDLCPRYEVAGKIVCPREIHRRIEPVAGTPRIVVSCRPVAGWEKTPLRPYLGQRCIHFESGGVAATVSTTVPPGDIVAETLVPLTQPAYLVLAHGTDPVDDIPSHVEQALTQTERWWRGWVGHLSLPPHHQREIIRSAITLKLGCVAGSGAILAAPTTSLPEEWGGERNWDYRFCWLRDAAFVLSAFRNLGQRHEMVEFLSFLLEIAGNAGDLHPVYRADRALPLPEEVHLAWRGYRDSRPVRSNNQAGEHIQNDIYGEMVVALSPLFLDDDLADLRTRDHADLLGYLTTKAAESIGVHDAGPWEFRSTRQIHAFSALASWAGLQRVTAIRERGYLRNLPLDLSRELARAMQIIERSVVDGTVRTGPTDSNFDASLLLLPIFGYPDRALNERTVGAIHRALGAKSDDRASPHLYRYRRADDFGTPRGSFVICSYWLVEALARLGAPTEAQRLLEELGSCANDLGLLAEHIDPVTLEQSGNFPQAYSHVGLINAAFALSAAEARARAKSNAGGKSNARGKSNVEEKTNAAEKSNVR